MPAVYAVCRQRARALPVPDELELVQRNGAVGLRVRVKPKSRRSAIVGVEQGALLVTLAAQPQDGQANEELLRLFARVAKVPKSQIELVTGATGRQKLLRIRGVDPPELRKLLLAEL
jgi:uncharacterized protein (TIGR00251 family)